MTLTTIATLVRNGTLVRTDATKMLDEQIRDTEISGGNVKALRMKYADAGYVVHFRKSFGKSGYVVYDYAKR